MEIFPRRILISVKYQFTQIKIKKLEDANLKNYIIMIYKNVREKLNQ